MKYIADTNFILDSPERLQGYNVVLPSIVLREIEELERRKSDRQLQYQVRQAKRAIKEMGENLEFLPEDLTSINEREYADNVILRQAYRSGYGILTNDLLMRFKAGVLQVPIGNTEYKEDQTENKGFKVAVFTPKESVAFYQNLGENTLGLEVNQYVVIQTERGHVTDVLRWTGKYHTSITGDKGMTAGFRTNQFGKFEPKDEYQRMAVDSIMNNQVTMIRGAAGTGKSLISLESAWKLVESDGYTLEIFVNPTPLSGAQEVGLYKGDLHDKLMQTSVGNLLASKFGTLEEVERHISEGRLKILPFVELRGYDTGDRKVVWLPEAQNLDAYLLKVALQRVTDSTKVIIDGDYHTQVDKAIYETHNGMRRLSEVLTGEDLYGEVELQHIYRSRLAVLVDRM